MDVTTSPRDAVLARCDPTVLLAVVVAVPLVLARVHRPGPPGVLWALAMVAVLATTPLTARRLVVAQVPFASFALGVGLVNAVTRQGDVVAVVGPLRVTRQGLEVGTALGLRTLLVGVCAAGFLAVVDPARLVVSLRQVARLPVRVAYALLAAHRLLDDLPGEWTTIRRAHAVRMPGPRRLSGSPRALARAAFTLLATSVRRAERVAVALESRGLGALPPGRRTSWRTARPTWRDGVLVACAAVAVCAALAVPGW